MNKYYATGIALIGIIETLKAGNNEYKNRSVTTVFF